MDFLPIIDGRSCEGCTKCCEGHLRADIKLSDGRTSWIGQEEDTGNFHACGFLKKGKGCGAYKDRPISPCVMFKCDYLTDPTMPDTFKPSRSNAIFTTRNIKDIEYTMLIEAGRKLDSEVLSWAISKHLEDGTNFAWRVLGNIFWIGSEEFNNMMAEDYPLLSETHHGKDTH
jgi:hypothetical protein